MKNLYEILEISQDATPEEIKKAYRELAVRYHPDKNPDAADQFAEINNANEILSDPERRAKYNATGDTRKEDFDQRFLGLIGQLLFTAIQTARGPIENADLIRSMVRSARQAVKISETACERYQEEAEQYRGIVKRMTPKENNPFIMILDSKINELTTLAGNLKNEIEFTTKAIDKLNDFKYDFEDLNDHMNALLDMATKTRMEDPFIEIDPNNGE